MTYEQAVELLDKNDGEYGSERHTLNGLILLAKYEPDGGKSIIVSAEHDEVFFTEFRESMTEKDILQMNRYGFQLDEDAWCKST